MKIGRLFLGAAAAAAACAIVAPSPVFAQSMPTLSASTSFSGVLFDRVETVSFVGSNFCGSAGCEDTVFVGLWVPNVSGAGSWIQSQTMPSTAWVGDVSGSFTLRCAAGNATLYAYDLTQGVLISSIAVPSFSCPSLMHFGEKF
jgi:hypothetical protein